MAQPHAIPMRVTDPASAARAVSDAAESGAKRKPALALFLATGLLGVLGWRGIDVMAPANVCATPGVSAAELNAAITRLSDRVDGKIDRLTERIDKVLDGHK